MQLATPLFFLLLSCFLAVGQSSAPPAMGATAYPAGQSVTLSFEGPQTSEDAPQNPFLYYRLVVDFIHQDTTYSVPGFYAADGQADETGAEAGNVWQVHFLPPIAGGWTYQVSFRQGDSVAISDDPQAGEPIAFDGTKGNFQVTAPEAEVRGKLRYVGERYLRFADGSYFLKGGAGSPENLLGYADFDGTYFGGEEEQREGEAAADKQMHTYQDHVADWHEGDPTWQNGKGKGLIGGLNYLASKGVNSLYFLTLNIEGDGKDVWPYTGYEERYRFDCSKLAQWEQVFAHADSLGFMLDFVTQETENERLLDGGDLGPQRKLYYRELIARFAHHRAVTWNVGEENGYAKFSPDAQTDEQRRAMFSHFKEADPYQNFVVIHTHAWHGARDPIIKPLLGNPDLDGLSLQVGTPAEVHAETQRWIDTSRQVGKQWVVNLDEIGPHFFGALPDEVDPDHDTVRYESLWGNLMAGGGGVEWYFGYRYANDDLGLETWRTRDKLWDQTRVAVNFFHEYLPFWEMKSADDLVDAEGAYCFAQPGEIYAIYLRGGGATLDVGSEKVTYEVHWFDPKRGGELQTGGQPEVSGSGKVELGAPPNDGVQDWVVLVRKKDS